MQLNLANGVKVTQVTNPQAAGTSTISSSILDMSGFDGVLFVASLGTTLDTSTQALQVQSNSLNQTGGMANVNTPTTYTDASGGNSNKCIVVDYYRPQQRYVRAQVVRGVANTVINCVLAIQYTARTQPVVNGTTVLGTQIIADL